MEQPTKNQMASRLRALVRLRRWVVVGSLTLPLVVGATSGVARAATTPPPASVFPATGAAALPAGSYSGTLGATNDGLTFYVSNTTTALQNITVGQLSLTCAPSGSASPTDVSVDSVPLKRNGTFKKSTTEHGVYKDSAATYKITFQGKAQGTKNGQPAVVGSISETLKWVHGGPCTSGPQAWTAARDADQTVTTGAPPAGSYSGGEDSTNDDLTFFVSNKMTALQNIVMGQLSLPCAPSGGPSPSDISVDSVPLKRNGSFKATTTEQGVYNKSPATYEITFEGYFHGLNADGVARAAGSITETMTYSNGTSYSCSSGPEIPWTVTRDATQTVTSGPPPVGTYSGSIGATNDGVSFSVASGQTALQNISVDQLGFDCAPSGFGSFTDISVDSVPLDSDGSFNATTTESGTYAGEAATYEITFQGYFHGLNAKGVARAAGSIIETMTYTNGTAYSCSSGPEVSWAVTNS